MHVDTRSTNSAKVDQDASDVTNKSVRGMEGKVLSVFTIQEMFRGRFLTS